MAVFLYPDSIPAHSFSSLARIRQALRSQAKVDPQSFLERLCSEAPEFAQIAKLAKDPLDGCLYILAADGLLPLYVYADSDTCYQIDVRAMSEQTSCSSLLASVEDGRFAIIRSRVGHCSLEADLDGQPIHVDRDIAFDLFRQPRPSASALSKAVQRVIDEAASQGRIPTNREVVEGVRKLADMQRASERQILARLKELKPVEWSKSGPRKGAR